MAENENDVNWEELMKQDDFWTHAFEHERFKQLAQQRKDAEKGKTDLEKKLTDLQTKFEALQGDKQTDLEKLQGQMAQLQGQFEQSQAALQEAEQQRLRLEIATEVGLPPTLAGRLTGDDREALVADAQALLPLLKPATPGNPPPPPRQPNPLPFTQEQLSDPKWVRENQGKIMAANT